jgi:hypothetical protein
MNGCYSAKQTQHTRLFFSWTTVDLLSTDGCSKKRSVQCAESVSVHVGWRSRGPGALWTTGLGADASKDTRVKVIIVLDGGVNKERWCCENKMASGDVASLESSEQLPAYSSPVIVTRLVP